MASENASNGKKPGVRVEIALGGVETLGSEQRAMAAIVLGQTWTVQQQIGRGGQGGGQADSSVQGKFRYGRSVQGL